MNIIEEKRNAVRMSVSYEIYCKLLDTKEWHKVLCVTLSDNGISFISKQPFEIGAEVKVSIAPKTTTPSVSHFFITIVRCQTIENDDFEIGASINLPDKAQ
jgi:hypothetical protein